MSSRKSIQKKPNAFIGDTFRASDAELLKSGILSDVMVICGDQTWNLHKTVICYRCPFFEKAFLGKFSEARDGTVTINGEDPVLVGWAITWLYSGASSEWNSESGIGVSKLVDFFQLVDYLDIDQLKTIIVSQIESVLLKAARDVQANNNDASNLVEPFLNDFFYAANTAYNTGSTAFWALRQPLVDFAANTRFSVCKNPSIWKRLEETPGLGTDILRRLITNGGNADEDGSLLVLTQTPAKCVRCKKERDFYPFTWLKDVDTSRGARRLALVGNCDTCHQAHLERAKESN
ncbi:Uu.00g037230.m01.CDS01 [Anthostomella pinea]|uniref:Uu.00g037230.m01.CDS01 n=1 Tax=Anthostomella pinea TaxID=933095 RepID=A0AAI8V9K0_9PEZI|nr:Uu.00g037230.m01.CDS01 [Anthostomella pinea]